MTDKLKQYQIMVTRPEGSEEELNRMIVEAGGQVIKLPTLVAEVSEGMTQEKLSRLIEWSQLIIFISRNAVSYAVAFMGNRSSAFRDREIYAAGRGTASFCLESGVPDVSCPAKNFGSEGLLEMRELSAASVNDRNILIIRGDAGRELLKNTLESRGARVKYAEVYCRQLPQLGRNEVKSIWENTPPDIIVLTSKRGLENLVSLTGEKYRALLYSRKLVVMSHRIADTAIEMGFRNVPTVADEQSDKGLMDAITRSVEQTRL